MRIIGTLLILLGLLLLPTIIFAWVGCVLIVVGCLIRIAFRKAPQASTSLTS